LGFAKGEPGIALIDVDRKGMPDTVKARVAAAGGFLGALIIVVPALKLVALVARASTSSGIRNRATGEAYPSSGGFHCAVAVVDCADIPRFLIDLHDRLWLAGFGWGWGSACGSFLDRSLVDKACGSPERLVFEGKPIIEEPLEQAPRDAVAREGALLDTIAACPPLTPAERLEVERLKDAERARLKPELDSARGKWSEGHIKRLVEKGLTEDEAQATVNRWIDRRELTRDFPLIFDDRELAGATVADVLAAPKTFIECTLADPVEGPAYGRGKAIVFRRKNGSIFINSFAHGGAVYELKGPEEPGPDRFGPPYGEARDADEIEFINGRDVRPRSVRWLWLKHLQRGVINLLVGRPGGGKSSIALAFSATVASGGAWPDGEPFGDPESVLFWSGEDAIDDTLIPRFLAAGGEPSNIEFISAVRAGNRKRPFDPGRDMATLERRIARFHGTIGLIVIDPVVVMVRSGDSHKNADTRIGLQPFHDLCAAIGCCGLGVHHLTKRSEDADPIDRVSGSLAFGALPRAILLAARDMTDETGQARALIRGKVSNAPDWGGFSYRLDVRELEDEPGVEAQRVLWGETLEGSARDILARLEGKVPAESAGSKARVFVRDALADGPRLAAEVIAEGAAAGLAKDALLRALKRLGGRSEKHSYKTGWVWELPK
jgi:hypothetical protein